MKGTCDGLVISEREYGDNDCLMTVLTAEHGKMIMIVKGVRSITSKTRSLCRLFTYANYEFYEKNGRRWVSGGCVIRDFFDMSLNIEGYALASYIVQLASEITGEGVPAEAVLRMTLNSLHAIEKGLKPLYLIKGAYEVFAARESGFAPDMSGCSECDSPIDKEGWLDVMNGRLICAKCFSEKGRGEALPTTDEFMTQNVILPVDGATIAAWRYVSEAPLKRAFAFALNTEQSIRYFEKSAETYIVNHLETSFEALEFYHNVKE